MARKTKKFQQRNRFIIITNGKETEKNYFNALKGYRKSIYDIKIEFENADPAGLIHRAIREKNTFNRVWIVFDKDQFPSDVIYDTLQIANQNDIGVAFSNVAFEVWLISHFKEFSQEKNADELIVILDTLLKEKGYDKGYKKNDVKALTSIFLPILDIAAHNADVALQKRIVDFNNNHPGIINYPYCDWNSCTTVHKLIEALNIDINADIN